MLKKELNGLYIVMGVFLLFFSIFIAGCSLTSTDEKIDNIDVQQSDFSADKSVILGSWTGTTHGGDFNHDGKQDLLAFFKFTNGDSQILGWHGATTGLSDYLTCDIFPADSYNIDAANYYTGDFNGDGKTDLMAFYKYPNGDSEIIGWYAMKSGFSTRQTWVSYSSTVYARDAANYYTGDFNGDGKTDLMAFYKYASGSSKIFGWYGTSSGLSSLSTWASYSSTVYARDAAIYYTGDFNGDGKTDLMAFYKYASGSSKIFGWYGTSSGLSSLSTWASYSSTVYARDAANYYTEDFNGDGKSDLMAFYKYASGASKIFGWYGTASGLTSYSTWASYTAAVYSRDTAKYRTGDFNGDGKSDLIAFREYSSGTIQILGWYGNANGLNPYQVWFTYY